MMNDPEHSQFPSIKLDQLVYVELESNNGGMMLSVSEEGFSFRAVTPVRPSGKMRFSFVINGTEKLEGNGKIDWTQDDGKVAGLQFADVTPEFLTALRRWLSQLSAPAVPSFVNVRFDTPTFGQNRALESPNTPRPEPVIERAGVQHPNEFGPSVSQILNLAEPNDRDFPVAAPETMPVLSEWEYPRGLQDRSRPRIHGAALAAIVIAFVALVALLYSYHEAAGQSLISLGQKMSATKEVSAPQPTKVSDAPKSSIGSQQPMPPATSATPQDRPSESGTIKDSRYRPDDVPVPVKPETTVPETWSPTTQNPEVRSHDPVDQARSLWSAVAQGNTSAEVALAKLYLIGGGVTKNCDQARVLLKAAAKKGNGEAIDKLSQIDQQGCP